MIYKPDKVSKMKGADIIAEYMMKEKIPYMIGYAGHGAIGMLDSFFNKQDDIKIVWPRIETACGFMADASAGLCLHRSGTGSFHLCGGQCVL